MFVGVLIALDNVTNEVIEIGNCCWRIGASVLQRNWFKLGHG
jgi:hypothetical protein